MHAGYIRQSRRADLDVALSPESQRRDIEALAERDGIDPEDLTIFVDLGRSGGHGKEKFRRGYHDLLAALESGKVETLYTKAMTRIGRSVPELYSVLHAAEDHGVRIVTMKEGVTDPASPMGKAQFGMMAVFAEFERDLAVDRALDNAAMRRARGEKMGRLAFGEVEGDDVGAVLDAFRAEGTFTAAARRLNAAGVETRLRRKWNATTVRNVVERHAPEVLPPRVAHGARPRSAKGFKLYRLVACPRCGTRMTAWRDAKNERVYYRCHAADADPAHPSTRVAELKLLPAVEAEWALYRDPDEEERGGATAEAQREALMAERRRVVDMRADGLIDREESRRRVSSIDTKLAALIPAKPGVVRFRLGEPVPEREYNRLASDLFERVELDPATLEVARVVWRNPDWRGEPS